MTTDDKYLPYAGLDTEKFIEWLHITKGNGYNAYDYTSDLSQTKNIAKKNFSVLFSSIFSLSVYIWVEDNTRGGKTRTKEVETGCVKGKHTKTQNNDYTQEG